MGTVHVELPGELAAQLDSSNISGEAIGLIALELFRENRVSLGRAAELCAMPLAAFMQFSAERGVPPLTCGEADLEADRQTLDRLGL